VIFHRFGFPDPDDEDEDELRQKLTETAEDRKRAKGKVFDKDYPDTCPECGCRSFQSFSQYYCTNIRCKWFDSKRLGPQGRLTPLEHNPRGSK
jgi:hypothetical protein